MHEAAPSGPSGLWSPALQSNSDTSPSGGQSLKKDATNHSNAIVPATPDRKGSPPQKSKKSLKDREYTVISISQLRTVLKREKRVHSGEPELKKTKVTDALESRQEGAGPRGPDKVPQAAARDSDMPQVSPDTTEQLPGPEQRSAPGEQAREVFRSERTQAKRSAPSPDAPKTPRKQRRTKANEVSKENECLEFDASASNDIGSLMDPKQDEESLKLNAEGQGETSVCSVEKAAVTSTYLPADALNLLADLALSSNGDKVPHGKCGLKQAVRAKSCPDPESVLHVLLKRPAGPARRPAKSPFPEGLVVAREWALVITKDHAYCQASSLLSAAPPSAGQECVTLLDPGGDPVKRPGQCERRLDEPGCKDARRTRVRVRHVVVKGDSVQVTRQWKEPYDFGFDSRFTNEPKEKTVGRALHGRWNVDMEDTDEQILLIFHTWVGLFYSRSTSRFFQIDPDCLKLRDRKATRDDQKIELFHMSALYNANVQPATRSNVAAARIPKSGDERANVAEPHPSDVLDLSLRSSGAFNGSPAKRKEVPEADAGSVGTCLVSSTEADRLVDAGESRPPEPATGPGFEAYRVSGGAAMCDEEDTAETRDLDGGSGSGSENDSVTSYAEVLDGSSAYHQLCQQTADLWKCAGTSSRLTEDVSPHAPCDAIVPVKGDSGGAAVREPVTTTAVDVTTELSEPSAEDEGTQSGTLHNGSGEGGPEDDEAIRDDRPNIGRCGTERENEDLPQDSGGSQGHSEILPVDTACEEGTSTLVPVERRFEGGENKDELIVDDRTECENECEGTVETGTGKDASEDLPCDLEDGLNRSEILPVDGMSEEEKREGNGENRDEIIIDDLSNSEQSWSECETECETECEGTAEASEDPSCDLEGGQTHSEILFNDSVSEEMSMLVQEKRDDSGENKDDITMDAHEDIPSEGDQGCSDILPCVKQTSVDDSGEKINSEVNVCLEMDSRAEHRSETSASVLDMTTIVHARSFAEDNWEITETHAGLLTHGCSFEESRKEDVNIPLVPSQATHEDDRAQIPEPEEASRDSECPLHSKDLPVEDLSQRSLPANKEMSSNDGPDPADLEKAGHLDGFSVYGLDLSRYAKPGTSLHNNPSSCTKDLYETDDSSHSDQNLMQTEYDDEGYEGTFNYLSGDEGVQDYSVKTLCLRYKKQSSKKTGFTLEPAEEHTSRTDLKDKSSGMSAPFLNKHLLYGAKESDLNGSWSDEHVESPPRVRRSQRTMAKDMGHEHEQFSSSECGSSKTLHPKRSERHRIHESNLEAELQEMELDHDPFHQSEKKSYTALDYRMGGTFFHPRQSISPLDEPEHEPEPYWDHTSIMAARRRKGPKEGLGLKLEQEVFSAPEPATVTSVVVDSKGNRTIFEGHPSREAAVRSRSQTVKKTCHRGTRRYVERFLRRWDALHQDGPDVTQASMDREFLIFSQKMKQILKTTRRPSHHAVKRGRGKDRNVSEGSAAPARRGRRDLPRLRRDRAGEAAAQSFRSTMAEVCSGKGDAARRGRLQERQDPPRPQSSRNVVSCGDQTRRDFKRPRHDTDSVVRRACKMKYKFYILVTSADPFFRETKELLELEGHTEVHPEEFDLHGSSSPSTLLVILKNEDIARHICEVPNLLELKKSSGVLFAGIDRPDDVVKLTHQELFCRGGFVVFDGAALRTLSLENMKEVTRFLEELGTRGRWRWFLHYRDSRWLRESSRSSREAQNMKHFMDRCRDAGVVEVLPFHDCDSVSCERPDYLRCLTSLQVQNAATRFPVFVTDTPADSFGRNGIFTINMNTFSQSISRDSCTVS
ncbi:uncharacterized protein tasor2 [Denticeps clupeoides]|uniref:uncharacterized protein tasor2 n=1 Tax=Denticeps clupeoides TaxID=299321 RepID=UPI0010A2E480|nr:uncharacterized protein LOC114779502 [Denticeps clupeoides]